MRRALVLLAVVAFVLPAASAGASLWTKRAAFDREALPPGGYEVGHWFEDTPLDGASIPYDYHGYAIPASWSTPGDSRLETGRSPAWTSAGWKVRIDEPSGAWVETTIRDDRVLVVDLSDGTHREHEDKPRNFTRADFARCEERESSGRCVRYAGDSSYGSIPFFARDPGTYALTLTLAAADGTSASYATTFSIVARPPTSPERVVALPGPGPGRATVLWSPHYDDGGAAVTSYRVYRSDGGLAALVGETAETSFTDSGLGTGLYTYRVAAVNSAGESLPSSDAATLALAKPVRGAATVVVHAGGSSHSASVEA